MVWFSVVKHGLKLYLLTMNRPTDEDRGRANSRRASLIKLLSLPFLH